MPDLLHIIAYLLVFCGVINLVRMSLFLIGSDLYGFFQHLKFNKYQPHALPKISIIIPAFNEAHSIKKSISSVLSNQYPKDKIEVIVVNDGSTDKTTTVLKSYSTSNSPHLKIIDQKRSGKAIALNNGMKNHATGELVMCLDADSYLAKDALSHIAKYFEDPRVIALASNVKIAKHKGLLNLIQRYEYLICYQMKRAQTVFNIEYIIGGIGSVFRKSTLEKVGFYDGNTVTEDIDLTMKLLRNGNKDTRVIYGSDVIAYTQGVLNINDLIKQRYRWKWGRSQTFLKNHFMFFSRDKKFSKGLSWLYLPYALFSDIAFLLEPLFVGYILFLLFKLHDVFTFLSAFILISLYLMLNVLIESSVSFRDKVIYVLLAPFMYFLFYILSFVEYIALLKALINLRLLKNSLNQDISHWKPVQRLGFSN